MTKKGILFCSAILAILLSLVIISFLTKSNVTFSSIRPFPNSTLRDLSINLSLLPNSPTPLSKEALTSLDKFIRLSKAIEIAEKITPGKAFAAFFKKNAEGKFVCHIELITGSATREYAFQEIDIDAHTGEIIKTKILPFLAQPAKLPIQIK